MRTKNGKIRCDYTGKFIAQDDFGAMTYTPFGRSTDTEPPESIEICGDCVAQMSASQLDDIKDPNKVWMPATPLFANVEHGDGA